MYKCECCKENERKIDDASYGFQFVLNYLYEKDVDRKADLQRNLENHIEDVVSVLDVQYPYVAELDKNRHNNYFQYAADLSRLVAM